MPQGEVPRSPGSAPVTGIPQELKFHPLAIQRVEEAASGYQIFLRRTAEYICVQDGCDEVQLKHVKHAEDIVCRMAPDKIALGDNYQIWWLIAGICLASALALPDASQLFFGAPAPTWGWLFIRLLFVFLIVGGVCCAVVAYLIALGPHQPKWFVDFKTGVGKIAKKRPWN